MARGGSARRSRSDFAGLGAARVAIGYLRSDSAAEETAEELAALGAEPVLVRGNISSDRVLEEVALLGALDVLVHNAATGVIRPALETEDKHWDWTMTANTRALLALTRVVAPQMLPGASIIGISSLGSQRVLENYSLVGTSKAALEALIRYLAVELAPRGIRVERRLGRRRRHRRARALPEQGGDARASAVTTRPAGSCGPRTSPTRLRSSARRRRR